MSHGVGVPSIHKDQDAGYDLPVRLGTLRTAEDKDAQEQAPPADVAQCWDVQLLCGHLGPCVRVCVCVCPPNSAVRRAGTSGTQCFCSLLQAVGPQDKLGVEAATPTRKTVGFPRGSHCHLRSRWFEFSKEKAFLEKGGLPGVGRKAAVGVDTCPQRVEA